ncbi:MAG: ABC transporter permease, partial [Roseimicrobium sp.]
AYALLRWQSFTVGNEGVTLAIMPDLPILIRGMITALALGLLASLYPAWKAAHRPIVASLRSA